MTDDFPVEKDVLHLRTLADVVDHQKASGLLRALIDYDSNVRDCSTQIPGDQITGTVVPRVGRKRKRLSVAREENHQVGNTAMIDIGIRSLPTR